MVSLPLRNSRICSQVSDSAFCIRICIRPRNALPLHIFRIILYWNQVLFQDHLVLDNSPRPPGHALWYSVAEPFRAKEWTPNARSPRQILKPDLVSVLVSTFRPNGVNLVDFRNFR